MNNKCEQRNSLASAQDVSAKTNKVQFKRRITLLNGIGLVVGICIGSGIFVSPQGVYTSVGCSVTSSLIVWSLCGIFSMVGSLCYSELGTTITRSGGDYVYILEAFGALPAFLNLWVSVLIIRPTTQAIIALTFAYYIVGPIFQGCQPPQLVVRLIAALCLCLLTYINSRSVRWAMSVQDIFAATKLLALAVIIFTGLYYIAFQGEVKYLTQPSHLETTASIQDLSSAFYAGLFAFGGWNFLNFVTEELQNPHKNLPRAAIAGILIVTLVYVLANVAYFAVLSPAEIIESPAIAMLFASKTLGPIAWMMPLVVAFSTFGGVNGIIFTSARLFCIGAQEKQLPSILGMLDIHTSTPVPSLIFSCVCSLFMLVWSDVYLLINYFSVTNWLWTGIVISALISLRRNRKEMHRPIQFPMILHVGFALSCFALTILAVFAEPINAIIGTFILILGIPVYYLKNHYSEALSKADRVTQVLQKIMFVVTPGSEEKVNDL